MTEAPSRPKPTKDALLEVLRDAFTPNDLLEEFATPWEELVAVRAKWLKVWRLTETLRQDHWWSLEARLSEDDDVSFYASIGLYDPDDEHPTACFPALFRDPHGQVVKGAFAECYVQLPKVRDPLQPDRAFRDFLQEALNALATIYKVSGWLSVHEAGVTSP